LRLATLTLLFFAQGVPWGFFAITMPAYAAERGLDEAGVGALLAMSYLPYAFKFLGGPLVDSFTIPRFGKRRPWIVFAQLMMAVTAAGLLAIDDPRAELGLLSLLILAHTIFNALQNVAVDALAIDLLPPDERGKANGLMYGAKYAGGIVGGSGMGAVIAWRGFHTAVVIQVVILLAIAVVPLLVHERPGQAPTLAGARVVRERSTPLRASAHEVIETLRQVFRLRAPVLCAVLMLLANLAAGVLQTVAPVLFMKHLHWEQAKYTEITGGPGLAIGAIGAAIAGFLADKLGHRRLVALATATMGAGWLVFAVGQAYWNDTRFVYTLFFIEPLTQSILTVALYTLCMDTSVKRTAATQFAVYTSLVNLSTILGARVLSVQLRSLLDYRGIYLACAAFQVALIVMLPFIDPTETRRALPEEA
jgi:PAT family beta-lactamase induction signal transducer AmpG